MKALCSHRASTRRGSVVLEALVALFVLSVGAGAAFVLLQRSMDTLRQAEVRGPAAPLVLQVARETDPAAADSLDAWGLVLRWEHRGDSVEVQVRRSSSDATQSFVLPRPMRGAP